MELDDPFAEWIPLTAQVPRKDQIVRVMTIGGIEHQAVFTVAYTTAWPEGASWMPTRDEEVLAFWDVWIWSPNPEASAPTLEEAWTPEPMEPVAAPALDDDDAVQHPAIVAAVLDEIGRGKNLLATLPEEGLGWTPQESIPTLGVLACRMVRVLERIQWIVEIDDTERTLEPPPEEMATAKDIQDAYANGAKPVRAALDSLDDAALEKGWTLTYAQRPRVEITRADALLLYGLRPLVSVSTELSVLLRALGQAVEHPTPEWPFGDEAEAAIVPEFDEEEPPADKADSDLPQGADAEVIIESTDAVAAGAAPDSDNDEVDWRSESGDSRAESYAGRSFGERFRIRATRASGAK